MTDLIRRAHAFAIAAHGDQRRKYTNEPYVMHCEAVAYTVMSIDADDEVVAAALLHDVIEDTKFGHDDLYMLFGGRVASLVVEVTDASKPSDGNRVARKAIDRLHLSRASPEGKTIKLADLIDNTSTIVRYDPGFAKVYLPEKVRLLDVLEGGNADLMARAKAMVDDGMRELGMTEVTR